MASEQQGKREFPRYGRRWPPEAPVRLSLPRAGRSRRPQSELPVGTVTFLFSDIVGSTPDIQRKGDSRARVFYRRHDTLIRALAAQLEGHIVRQDGDGFFLSFRSTRQALRCAISIQRGLVSAYADLDEQARVRIGMHVGETVEEGGDYYGTAVNLAARVRGEAGADQILVTGLVSSLAAGEPEFHYRFLRDAELKGIEGRTRLYELIWREEEIAAAEAGAQPPAPVVAASADEADLRRYAETLATWCAGRDLSEWSGHYINLPARMLEQRGAFLARQQAHVAELQEDIAEHHRLVVIGEGGSGKTTGLLEATRRAARQLQDALANPIPVFVSLRAWRTDQDFIDLVTESLGMHGLRRTREAVLQWLQAGRLLLALDGVNEIVDTILDGLGLTELESIPRRFPGCRLVISLRQHRASAQFAELPVVALQPLRPHDVLQYIAHYVGSPERAEAIFQSLGGRDRSAWLQSDSLINLARNPLMLNVIISHELTGDGTVRPSRASVLEAYTRHIYRIDAQRGSHVQPEVKEVVLGAVAFAGTLSGQKGPAGRSDLAQAVIEALVDLKQEALAPPGLEAAVILTEIDRRFMPPLLPEADQGMQYEWSHQLFRDYFAALDLRRRYFPAGRAPDRAPLQALLSGDGWHRWAVACILLSELLDDGGALALVEACLRADNLMLACRCLSHSTLCTGGERRLAAGTTVQGLAELLRLRTEESPDAAHALQDPFAVLCEALLERQPVPGEEVEPLQASIGTALLAAVSDVDATGVLAALTLGLTEPEVRAVAWAFGRESREVLALRTRILRLCALPVGRASPEQYQLRQGLLLALANAPDVLLLELCHRAQALMNADQLPAQEARTLARHSAGVHVVLARRLGLWRLAALLDEMVLHILEPEQYAQALALSEEMRLRRREHRLEWLGDVLDERLQRLEIEADVQAAMPSLSGVAAEIQRLGALHLPRAALRGLGRIVINVPDEPVLDRAVSALEELWPGTAEAEADAVPLAPAITRPGRRELVAYPPEGGFVRVLLQTVVPEEMDFSRRSAGETINREPLHRRMHRVLEELVSTGGGERIFVLTASGDVLALPAGSTPVDFAYYLHTRLGHQCVGTKVNGKAEPLTYRLRHGDRVEILVDPQRELPPGEWLERGAYLHTARAQKAVSQALEASRRADAMAYGRKIVAEELERIHAEPELEPRMLKALGFQRAEKLYEAVGSGDVARRELAYTLGVLVEAATPTGRGDAARSPEPDAFEGWVPVSIPADETLRPRYARCCRPQPGDPIVGYRSGQTVVVHHVGCPSAATTAGTREPVEARWLAAAPAGSTLLRVHARRSRTVAAAIRRAAEAAGIELNDLVANHGPDGSQMFTLDCSATAAQQLQGLVTALRRLPDVVAAGVTGGAGD